MQQLPLLPVPTFATEQYPKGLGPTVPEIELEKFEIKAHAKKCFSMIIPEVTEQMKASSNLKSVILCGIETHACITHTTLGIKYHIQMYDKTTLNISFHSRSDGDGYRCPHPHGLCQLEE